MIFEKRRLRKKYICIIFLLVVIYVLSMFGLKTKLTYLEYKSFNTSNDTYIELKNSEECLAQEFVMPYEIIEGVSMQIGTFARDNNSLWTIGLKDCETNEKIYSDEFNASLITDNDYYKIDFDKKIEVEKGKKYAIVITAKSVEDISSLAFYCSNSSTVDNSDLYYNGAIMDSDLCIKVYGGDLDLWWIGFATLIFVIVMLLIVRCYIVENNNKRVRDDLFVQAMIVGIATFLLLCTFSVAGAFSDESDNMYGGMIIGNGGVLYRDYVTQHTPVSYYLCAVFSLFGAGSIEQFRLSFYLIVAIIWGLIYIRHSDFFGKKVMTLIPVLEAVCISSVVAPYGSQVLSDGIQGVLTVLLMLEFLRYYQDHKLDWGRCIIISICIWGSFGAAFVSAYALVWVALIVLILEIKYWKDMSNWKFADLTKRYYKFLVCIIVPFIAAVIYFKLNNSLGRAFEQFYTFNREVYPKYVSGLGDNIAQPFISGVQNFFKIISDNFNSIIMGTATNVELLQLVIMILTLTALIMLFVRKRYIESVTLTLVMIFSATRGYGFHGMAAWYVAVMIIAIYLNMIKEAFPKMGVPVLGLCGVVLLSTFVVSVGNNLLYEQSPVSEIESEVIALTEDDENRNIYLDVWTSDSLYYFYKNRYPINRAVFMLPWYMDWYEKDNIEDLKNYNPKVVVYYEDEDAWGYTYYSVAFADTLKKGYTRLGDGGWQYNVWIRNE